MQEKHAFLDLHRGMPVVQELQKAGIDRKDVFITTKCPGRIGAHGRAETALGFRHSTDRAAMSSFFLVRSF